jgi:O-antigen/teichoic acid export membrane protein
MPLGKLNYSIIQNLFALGGWMSISNIISPLMTFLDRFIISGVLSVKSVAFYSTPYDMITRTLMLPYSVMAVVFPVLSAQSDSQENRNTTYFAIIRLLLVSMFPICFTVTVLSKIILSIWLGVEFAEKATLVLQILSFGVFANTVAQAPANLIQSSGDPKWMAILHLFELPLFVVALFFVTKKYGIEGTAVCWSGRMLIDAILLFFIVNHFKCAPKIDFGFKLTLTICFFALVLAIWPLSTYTSFLVWIFGILIFIPVAWFFILHSSDRVAILKLVNRS